jgi:4-diphosphocytidyl-2-C-methyl-D-erythritol kinase
MTGEFRRATVAPLAKINLSLRVLHRRPDGYHELRTVFQTISLGDRLTIEFRPGRGQRVELESSLDIPAEDNLVVRAARAVMAAAQIRGRVHFRLEKRIPAGGGLGGGSSDAAAVLLALPALAGRRVGLDVLSDLAAGLGSDVPFFLLGGTAAGLGRGTEVHPLPDLPRLPGLLVFPAVSVSTAEAYRALDELTPPSATCHTGKFQALTWCMGHGLTADNWSRLGENDFEPYAFERYPELGRIVRRLRRCGAAPAMMTGSGSSLFGLFRNREDAERARAGFRGLRCESFYLVSRGRYRKTWWQRLMGRLQSGEEWPPRSRYVR